MAAVAVVAIVIWLAMRERRTRTLRDRFGPEYDRAVESSDSKRGAESELAARAERRDKLDITPLSPGARERYATEWERVQARFVDDPEGAVREADVLIQSVMSERGYPMDDFDQRAADISSTTRRSSRTTAKATGSPVRTRSGTERPRTFGRRCSTTGRSSTTCSTWGRTSR